MELADLKWSEITIHTTNEAVEAIANILYEAGAGGVVIEDSFELLKDREKPYGEIFELSPEDYPDEGVNIKAYFPLNSFLRETIEEIKEGVENLKLFGIDTGECKVSAIEINEEDWATSWKEYYHPVKISDRFTIVPTWENYEPQETDELIIELDPGMAFGTGTHPTTVLSIKALEQSVKPGDTIYDVGTGSGVLSIAAALLGAEKIVALDLDELAVKSARSNCKLNKVDHVVSVKQNNLLNGLEEKADIIVANLLAEIIVQFTDDVYRFLNQSGWFIASGIISKKREEVEEKLRNAGFSIQEALVMEDWVTIIAKKR